MNRTGDPGHLILTEYDRLNFILDPDVHSNSSKSQAANSTLVNSFYFYENEQLAMLWILFLSIVVGNGSVLVGLLLDKRRGSRFNYFIKHLAIADLSVGFVSVLTDIVWKLTIEWNAGNVACKVVRYSQAVVTYSSTYLLVALTIDRFEAIRHPMNFFKSWRRAKFLVMAAWILGLLFSVPIIVLYEEKPVQGRVQCWIEFVEPWHWQLYMVMISLTVFFVPAFIIAGCYAAIIYTIWSRPNIPNRIIHRKKPGAVPENLREDSNSKRASSRGLIPKAKVKTIKMTLIIVFVFIFCWSPYIIFDLLQVFGYIRRTQVNIAVATFIQSLAPLNSAANPIIYCLFSTYACRHLRIQPLFQCLSKCCCGPRLRKSVKIADTSTSTVVSHAASGRYINLRHLTGVDLPGVRRETVKGSGNDLLERFRATGTEMIVTRAGRRMFPTLKFRLKGLPLFAQYIVYIDVIPVGETKYRCDYLRSEWTAAGPSDGSISGSVYVHPESPARGETRTSREHVSFDEVKLTDNRRPFTRDQVSLHSLHEYQPRIHILEVIENDARLRFQSVLEYIRRDSGRSQTFAFEQTAFIAVTAYQNQEITTLKIQSDPVAKGFRESLNSRQRKREKSSHGSSCLRRSGAMSRAAVCHLSPAVSRKPGLM